MNSGEGGFLTTGDPDLMARAIMLSGSYMLYERHGAGPDASHFTEARLETPNMSARMDNLRAAILLPQLSALEENVRRWNARYDAVEAELARSNHVIPPSRPEREDKVGSSIQFRAPAFSASQCKRFLALAAARGVELKWFGAEAPQGFTSTHRSWTYVAPQDLPRSDEIFATLFDMRLPLTFSVEDCRTIGAIIRGCAEEIA